MSFPITTDTLRDVLNRLRPDHGSAYLLRMVINGGDDVA